MKRGSKGARQLIFKGKILKERTFSDKGRNSPLKLYLHPESQKKKSDEHSSIFSLHSKG